MFANGVDKLNRIGKKTRVYVATGEKKYDLLFRFYGNCIHVRGI